MFWFFFFKDMCTLIHCGFLLITLLRYGWHKKVVKWKSLSHVQLCSHMNCTFHGSLQARMLEWVAFPFSRGSSQLRDQTQVSHKGSQGILEWVAYPFFSRSSQPRNQTGVSCIAGGFFTNWALREAQSHSLRIFIDHDAVRSGTLWSVLSTTSFLHESHQWSLGLWELRWVASKVWLPVQQHHP